MPSRDAATDWDSLMEREYPLVCRQIRKRIPAALRRTIDAEDVVSAAILAILESGSRKPYEMCGRLLFHVARLRLVDFIRHPSAAMRTGEVPWPDGRRGGDVFDVPRPGPQGEDHAIAVEIKDRIDAELGPWEREAFRPLIDGLRPCEAAASIGRPPWHVGRLRSRIGALVRRWQSQESH